FVLFLGQPFCGFVQSLLSRKLFFPFSVLFAVLCFFHGPTPPLIYTLSLHDALPISPSRVEAKNPALLSSRDGYLLELTGWTKGRSEEHTSELQSRFDLVCRLLLEKKQYRSPLSKK